jgi:type I restriction enzyme S subunit
LATDEVKCIDDEVPFDLPMGWEWRRLGSLSFDSADGPFGSNLKREHYTSNREVRIIQLSNIGEFGWKDSNVRYTTFAHLTTISRSEAFAGDIIIAKMMPAGRAIICPTLESKYVLSSDAVRFSFSTELEKTYLYYAINSPVFLEQVYGEVQGITRVRTSLQKLRSYLLPIPPINEQKKIVKIIDQLLTLTFNYEKAQDAINELNDHVKPLLKRSILQEAIQGRLVEQCETDEPASVLLEQIRAEKEKRVKAGLLKKSALQDAVIFKGDDNKYFEKKGKVIICIDEEIPFEIPDTWQWCRVKQILDIGSARRVHQKDWRTSGIPFYRAREIGKLAEYDHVDNELFIDYDLYKEFSSSGVPKPGDLMITAVGTLGKVYIVKNEDLFYYKDGSVLCLNNRYKINPFYLKHVIDSPMFKNQYVGESEGTTVATLTMVRFNEYLLPIPPLREQERIVKAIDNLASIMSR